MTNVRQFGRLFGLLSSSLVLAAACGGAKPVAKPVAKKVEVKKPVAKPETEEDRERKRHDAAVAIIPDGSNCLPAALKDDKAARLELAEISGDLVLCAIDTDGTRLLGAMGCWKIDKASGGLTYQAAAPLPGHGFDVKLDDRCARGYCLPKEATVPDDKLAHIAWNLDGTKVAVLVGTDVHLFDAASKAHASTFSVKGDKGVSNSPTAVHFVGDQVFVEGVDAGPFAAVWQFKADGTAVGPIQALGGKDPKAVSTYGGSFSILDKGRVAVAEQGYTTVTTLELDTGKRSKLVRKLGKAPCKAAELDAFWLDSGGEISPKCKDYLTGTFSALVGAPMVGGAKNFLAVLRGPRLGELAVIDPKTLAEKKAIKLAWCTGAESKDAAKPEGDAKE
jgi:hypothetical protein